MSSSAASMLPEVWVQGRGLEASARRLLASGAHHTRPSPHCGCRRPGLTYLLDGDGGHTNAQCPLAIVCMCISREVLVIEECLSLSSEKKLHVRPRMGTCLPSGVDVDNILLKVGISCSSWSQKFPPSPGPIYAPSMSMSSSPVGAQSRLWLPSDFLVWPRRPV